MLNNISKKYHKIIDNIGLTKFNIYFLFYGNLFQ